MRAPTFKKSKTTSMIKKIIKKNGTTFITANSLTSEEIEKIREKVPLNSLIKNELLKDIAQPKISASHDFIYIVLHFPIFDKTTNISKKQEIDFVLGKNFLIAVNYNNEFPPLQEFVKKIEEREEIANDYFRENAGILFFHIIQHLYKFTLRELDYTHKKIDYIEEQIFLKKEKEMVERISVVSRDIIEFGRAIKTHQRIWQTFEVSAENLFESGYKTYSSEILNEYFNLKDLFKSTEQTINSLQNTNDSLVSIKANDEMRIISIIAFTTFPLMLFSALFGMNTTYTPLVGAKGDFWIIVGIMALGVSVMYSIFKHKKWL